MQKLMIFRISGHKQLILHVSFIIVMSLGVLILPDTAGALTFTVNDTGDGTDYSIGDGICSTTGPPTGPCSLRAAIEEAMGSGSGHIIQFDSGLFGSPPVTITFLSTPPPISADLTIIGPGPDQLIVSGQNSYRPFAIIGGTVSMSGMTVAYGSTGGAAEGGCFSNSATLTIDSCVVHNCTAKSGGGIVTWTGSMLTVSNSTIRDNDNTLNNGGGLYNTGGNVTITNSTFSGNRSTVIGGGVANTGTGAVMTISNCTFYDNESTTGDGGALYTDEGTITIINSTFSNNRAGGDGGGIYQQSPGVVNLLNTILANNTAPSLGPDCNGAMTPMSGGYNLIENNSTCSGFSAPNDIIGSDPILGPLADNGGSTLTMALQDGSPAIDSASDVSFPSDDQRGVPRPLDGDNDGTALADIGAYEAGALHLTVSQAGNGGGVIDVNPAGADCGTGCHEYASLNTVTLAATPDYQSVFAGWTGDCSGSDVVTTVVVDGEKSCTGTFQLGSTVSQSVTLSGGTDASNYSILSAPLHPSNKAPDSVYGAQIGTYDTTKFRIGRWDPKAQAYSEYPSIGDVAAGHSVWWLSRDAFTVNFTGTETQANYPVLSVQGFALPIEQGWNMVGNPFRHSINVSDIIVQEEDTGDAYYLLDAANTITQQIFWVYPQGVGSYQAGSVLAVGQGGWVKKLTPGTGKIIFQPTAAAASNANEPTAPVPADVESPPAPPSGMNQDTGSAGQGGGCFLGSSTHQ